MPVQKEKKQTATLIAIIMVIAIVVLSGGLSVVGVPPLQFSFVGLRDSLRQEYDELKKLDDKLQFYNKTKINQKRDEEQAKLDQETLDAVEAQLLGVDPQMWFIEVFNRDGAQFKVRLSNYRKGRPSSMPAGMKLPNCQLFTYTASVEGTFNEIGKFIAHVENKYPLLAVRTISLRGRSADNPTCEGELEFRILAKK